MAAGPYEPNSTHTYRPTFSSASDVTIDVIVKAQVVPGGSVAQEQQNGIPIGGQATFNLPLMMPPDGGIHALNIEVSIRQSGTSDPFTIAINAKVDDVLIAVHLGISFVQAIWV